MHNSTLKRKANEFRVWRVGRSVDWDCTYLDIARETGISRWTVADICQKKGWQVFDEKHKRRGDGLFGGRLGVDTLITGHTPWQD